MRQTVAFLHVAQLAWQFEHLWLLLSDESGYVAPEQVFFPHMKGFVKSVPTASSEAVHEVHLFASTQVLHPAKHVFTTVLPAAPVK